MVNKDTSKKEELQSKKAITERKINELKRELKKIEGIVLHLFFAYMKWSILNNFSSRSKKTFGKITCWLFLTK